ncbi:hypothetical protein RYA05_05320 [Pseudomonas syringae pv. actinidiae]|nr:hypothetical protein [Pseudomonas syringae pv. actinidiae]
MNQEKLVDEINDAISRICLANGVSCSGLNAFVDGDAIRARFTIFSDSEDFQKNIQAELNRRNIDSNAAMKTLKSVRDGRSYKLVRINHDNDNLPFVVADTIDNEEFIITEQTLKDILEENS